MTSTIKTDINLNTSLLSDGQAADAGDVVAALTDALAHLRSGRLAVTANDTHVKHLDDAFTVSADFVKSIANAGGNEAVLLTLATVAASKGGLGANAAAFSGLLKMAGGVGSVAVANTDYVAPTGSGSLAGKTLDASNDIRLGALDRTNGAGAAVGDVPTWNGTAYAPSAPGGGGAEPVDIQITAGETLAQRDFVYLERSDSKWYKVDTNAVPIKVGDLRGVVQSASITANATGDVRVIGEVAGYTGLTAWQTVYAATTAGGYTQTRPTVSVGGGQVALIVIGVATSTSKVLVLPAEQVQYLKRESLANNASTTLTHHSDPQGRARRVRGYVASTVAGAALTTYASSNRDNREPLRGPSGAGGTTTIIATGTTAAIGNVSGTHYWGAQSFQVTAGHLTQFKVTFAANAGTPSGTVTWEICADGGTAPSTILATGTFTPTASAENTINVTDGPYLAGSTTYWLVVKPTTAQSSGICWNITSSSSSTYASGAQYYSTNSGSSWIGLGDLSCAFTTSATTARDKLAQSFQVTGTQTVDQVKLWLKKVGTPTGTLTLRIETNSAGNPSGTLADANATITVAESGLTTSYGWITFDFATNFSLSSSTTYWLVLSTDRSASAANYIEWGNDTSSPAYASGEMKAEASSSWSALTADAVFEVFGAATTYDEPCVIGRWGAGTRDLAVQFGDGSYANADAQTTFKNVSGDPLDITCIVEV
jgi:hypothetical protein